MPRLLIVPSAPTRVQVGARVELYGVLLRLPWAFANTVHDRDVTRDEPIYLYATDVHAATVRPRGLLQ